MRRLVIRWDGLHSRIRLHDSRLTLLYRFRGSTFTVTWYAIQFHKIRENGSKFKSRHTDNTPTDMIKITCLSFLITLAKYQNLSLLYWQRHRWVDWNARISHQFQSSIHIIFQLLGTDSKYYFVTPCSRIGLSVWSQARCTIYMATHWKITRLFSIVHIEGLKATAFIPS